MNSEEARQALAQAGAARAGVAARAAAPRWYYPAVGGCFLFAFASVSIDWDLIPFGVVLGISLGPTLLTMAAGHATGVSFNRYYATPGARRITSVLGPLLVTLIALGLVLEWGADLRWSMAACGVVALVATVVAGRRLDRAVTEELRA
ncbi:hypothetical protein HW130_18340 [Streptomyces sp. PKU-EA00015]|uniref:hypothetical protein n=1 Tax=Streptomyces sp. PKU-EA00015 TaxID=2748326 RepID=UPI0015A25B45|nr:hypothetical protein [Streptomyces sp. PKU-EA00015]NWF28203.1 hypothetical protein [Streptomyces sp. PKU-EA00015]